MVQKEANNLKKREFDFNGILASGELEAQVQYQEQEINEFKAKLEEERAKNQENITEMREQITELTKQKHALEHNNTQKKLVDRMLKENQDLAIRNRKQEKRIIDLQNLLTQDSDKLTQA
jgi:sRNA-binding protein